MRCTARGLRLALALTLAAGFAAVAEAAVVGEIKGRVTDERGGPLAGVTVIVTSPALQGEQAELTDGDGYYVITNLPPGTYVVRFFHGGVATPRFERRNVILSVGQTVLVSARVTTREAKAETFTITERAPAIDVGTTSVGTILTPDVLGNLPLGRNFDEALFLTPGYLDGGFSSGTWQENSYLVNGVNTTGVLDGGLRYTIPNDFIQEIQVLTGGYNAEWGRATGGFVNVVTKQGSNEFHGGAWAFTSPWSAAPRTVELYNQAIATVGRSNQACRGAGNNCLDLGVDLGGPIVKDKAWFYVGFMPQVFFTDWRREYRALVDANGDGQPDLDPSKVWCPAYLRDRGLCAGKPAPEKAELLGSSPRHRISDALYQMSTKLTFRPHPDHDLTATFLGAPEKVWGDAQVGAASISRAAVHGGGGTYTASLRWLGKFLHRHLQVEALLGYYREETYWHNVASDQPYVIHNPVRSLYDYNTPQDAFPEACRDAPGSNFVKCPVQGFVTGPRVGHDDLAANRLNASLRATAFVRALGHHALKLGFDPQLSTLEHSFGQASGYYAVELNPDAAGRGRMMAAGNAIAVTGTQCPPGGLNLEYWRDDSDRPKHLCQMDFLTASSRTTEYHVFLQDRWNILPNLTLDAGVRWEGFQVVGDDGYKAISIWNDWAPRVGVVYDWTGQGKSKLYASYGRFFESVPLYVNDAAFAVKGSFQEFWSYPSVADMNAACGSGASTNVARCRPTALARDYPGNATESYRLLFGGERGKVVPGIQAQRSDQVSAGIQYEIATDLVAGVAYERRWLGMVMEDMSPDNGNTYYVGNPGRIPDTASLERQIAQLQARTDPASVAKLAELRKQLADYRALGTFPKPRRDYNALTVTLSKRLARRWYLNAAYVYARTIGNYPGLGGEGNAIPNLSPLFDLKSIVVNSTGPLPQDVPHTVLVSGYRSFSLYRGGELLAGLVVRARSGYPINTMAPYMEGFYYVYLLPRGAAGRTPWNYQVDASLRYQQAVGGKKKLIVSLDAFNVLNLQQVAGVDEGYTYDSVEPIAKGRAADLRHLKNSWGAPVALSYNYGNASYYQAPFALRLGARLTF
jgi:hypothetical protein